MLGRDLGARRSAGEWCPLIGQEDLCARSELATKKVVVLQVAKILTSPKTGKTHGNSFKYELFRGPVLVTKSSVTKSRFPFLL